MATVRSYWSMRDRSAFINYISEGNTYINLDSVSHESTYISLASLTT